MKTTLSAVILGAMLAATHAPVSMSAESAPQPQIAFDIQPQPVGDALNTFASQSGLQVLFLSKLGKDVIVPRVEGKLSAEQALQRLLQSTGLRYEFINGRTVTIRAADGAPSSADAGKEGGDAQTDALKLVQSESPAPGNKQNHTESASAASTESAARNAANPIEEIVVTAQKRVERLMDVPVPVTLIDTQALANTQQLRLQDFYTQVPGLNVILGADSGAPRIAIRGITTGGSTNPTVATVIDDIPFGPTTTAGIGQVAPDVDPSDVASIEVLRGPQGTLYGASSLGGLVKYVTVDPSTERLSGRLQSGVTSIRHGDELGFNVRGAVNAPVSETLAIRGSGFFRRDPGYIDNVQTGEDGINTRDAYGGQVAALWKPIDGLSVKLNALYQNTQGDGTSEIDTRLADMQQSSLIGSGHYGRSVEAYSATIKADLGAVELTSLSGYSTYGFASNLDGSPAVSAVANAAFGVTGVISSVEPVRTRKFTQEVRLAGPIGESIDWLAGVFYTKEKIRNPQHIYAINPTNGAQAGVLWDKIGYGTYEDYAGFANLTFRLSERFDVQAGGRLSRNSQTTGPESSFGQWNISVLRLTTLAAFSPQLDQSDDAFTYLLTPRFRISSNLMTYARIASGYRPGGANAVALGLPAEYESDTTQNYELGIKGDLLDRALSFDLSLYVIDWKDMQIQLRNTATTQAYFVNAGKARSQGVELSATVRPAYGLTLGGWVSFNDAELVEDFPATSGAVTVSTAVGFKGDRLPYSARRSGNISADQEFALGAELTGYAGATLSYVGERTGVFRSAPARQVFPAYTQLDLRLGARKADWSLDGFVTNVTDKRGVLRGGFDSPFGFPTSVNYTQPRTIGFSVSKGF